MKSALLILPLLALLGVALWWAIYAWNSVVAGSHGPDDDMRERTLGPPRSGDSAADGKPSCALP